MSRLKPFSPQDQAKNWNFGHLRNLSPPSEKVKKVDLHGQKDHRHLVPSCRQNTATVAKNAEVCRRFLAGLPGRAGGELRKTTSTLQEGDLARQRAEGQGARLLRGEEHKDFDADVRLQKQVKKNDVRAQKEETAKATDDRAVSESGVMLCRHCGKVFVHQQCLRAHEDGCVEQSAIRKSKRKTAPLRPAALLAQDQVHSAVSLSIGQGNFFRGQENKEMFFPTTIKFYPSPPDVPVVKEGWACKGASGVKGGAFKKSQRDFLLTLFNNNGGQKLGRRTLK